MTLNALRIVPCTGAAVSSLRPLLPFMRIFMEVAGSGMMPCMVSMSWLFTRVWQVGIAAI